MHHTPTQPHQPSVHGGLLVALVAFAFTWFVVNGGSLPTGESSATDTYGMSVCVVPTDRPTSWFFNTPVQVSLPLYGS